MGGSWGDHPELVKLRENYRKSKVSAEEVAEVKAWLEAQKKNPPEQDKTVRVIRKDKPFRPSMTIRLDHPRYKGVYPVLSGKR